MPYHIRTIQTSYHKIAKWGVELELAPGKDI